jgi:hypothetical protein
MITSSVLNSVTFKNLDGGFPNKWNTLHANRKQGGFSVIPYCQKFNKDDIIYLQFESDSATVPDLDIFYPHFKETIAGTLLSSYVGDDTRYFYGFEITLGAAFYDKKISFVLTQDTDILTSEPIICEDLSEQIAKGTIKKVKYTNLDRGDSDLSNYFVDWSATEFMYFYIEAVDIETNDSEETEIIEGVQSKDIAASTNYSGINLQVNGVPDYLALKLKAASSLDYFEVNGIQYIKDSSVDISRYGNSTLHTCTIKLTEKNTVGLNVDDLGIEFIDQNTIPMAIVVKRNTGATGAGWSVENPEGYMLHSVFIKHAITSVADAVVKLGTTIGGAELIDEVQGDIKLADYGSAWAQFPAHYLKNPDAAHNLYFTITGAGAVLDIIVNFDTVKEL